MKYRFGPFTLDSSRFVLARKGEPIQLEPRTFSLLVHLVENRGRVLPREDLIQEVWEEQFVSDAAVSQAIYAIRRALGDDAKKPVYVRTVHGRGFEFMAEVVPAEDEPGSPETATEPPPERRKRVGSRRLAGVGLLAAAALLGWLALDRWPGSDAASPTTDTRDAGPARILILRVAGQVPDPELELLGLGVTDSLLRDLATVDGLDALSSDGLGTTLEDAGSFEELMRGTGVGHLLEGSISRNDTATGARLDLRLHSLGEARLATLDLGTFELPFLATSTDLNRFEELRRAIGTEVVQLISPALEPPATPSFGIRSPQAYRLAMSAYLAMTDNFCDGGRAGRLLERALELEPGFGPAYGFLAINQYNRVWACGEPAELLEDALRNLDRARQAGGIFRPDFESTFATILVETGRLEEAWELNFDTVTRHPESAAATYQAAYILRYAGLLGEARTWLERALDIDPFFFVRGPEGEVPNLLLYENRLDDYLEALPKSEAAYHRFYRGFGEYLRGDPEAAREALTPAFETQPGDLFGKLAQALLAILDGDRSAAAAVVGQIEQQRKVHGILDGEVTYKEAQLFALAGEPERALASFARAVEQGFLCTPYFVRDPVFDPLRGDPSFQETLGIAEKRRRAFAERFGLDAESPHQQG